MKREMPKNAACDECTVDLFGIMCGMFPQVELEEKCWYKNRDAVENSEPCTYVKAEGVSDEDGCVVHREVKKSSTSSDATVRISAKCQYRGLQNELESCCGELVDPHCCRQ
jgi:hypothetical protein